MPKMDIVTIKIRIILNKHINTLPAIPHIISNFAVLNYVSWSCVNNYIMLT